MSNFGAKLEELIEKNKLRASELSRASGINDALISRWINGQQNYVSQEALEAITVVISKNPTEQAELIRAHLLDECVGHGSHLIEIHILGSSTKTQDADTPYRIIPPLKIQRALEILCREAITDSDVRNILLSMASLCETNSEKLGAPGKLSAVVQTLYDVAGAAPPVTTALPPSNLQYKKPVGNHSEGFSTVAEAEQDALDQMATFNTQFKRRMKMIRFHP